MITVLTACGQPVNNKPVVQEGLVVYTSIYPMYDFAKHIGKDKIQLKMMVPPGAEPHDWEPTAKLMAELEQADVFIYNGVEMEPWVPKVLGAIGNKNMLVVDASKGISLLLYEEHGHEHEDEEQQEDDHEHGLYDPHIWLDPLKAIQQAENIKNSFIEADSNNKDFYEANFKEFREKLELLDQSYREGLKNRKRDEIVVAHGAFGYLAERYDLEQISISGISPQEEPSAAKMAEISKLVKQEGIKAIFFETLTNPRLSQVLAQETGAETAVLNPGDGVTKEELEAGKGYIQIMEENLETLKKALGE